MSENHETNPAKEILISLIEEALKLKVTNKRYVLERKKTNLKLFDSQIQKAIDSLALLMIENAVRYVEQNTGVSVAKEIASRDNLIKNALSEELNLKQYQRVKKAINQHLRAEKKATIHLF